MKGVACCAVAAWAMAAGYQVAHGCFVAGGGGDGDVMCATLRNVACGRWRAGNTSVAVGRVPAANEVLLIPNLGGASLSSHVATCSRLGCLGIIVADTGVDLDVPGRLLDQYWEIVPPPHAVVASVPVVEVTRRVWLQLATKDGGVVTWTGTRSTAWHDVAASRPMTLFGMLAVCWSAFNVALCGVKLNGVLRGAKKRGSAPLSAQVVLACVTLSSVLQGVHSANTYAANGT
ncbi:hypothetical protein PBRA_005433, partial [Plasmodiophora brassicae]